MRKFLISLLFATALTPAVAQGQTDRSDRRSAARSERSVQRAEARAERAEPSSADRPARAEGSNSNRPARVERAERPAQIERAEQPNVNQVDQSERIQRADRPARADRVDREVQPVQQVEAPQAVQPVQPAQDNEQVDSLVDAYRHIGRNPRYDKDHDDDDHDWSRDWRKDHRYDWWGYRSRYGSLFRLGHYYDPYGWGYRRWSIGYSLWPSYYGSSYWLDDPWMYRLPPVYGPYRWVRYYDDALLVNIYTGQVVDVVYKFFW